MKKILFIVCCLILVTGCSKNSYNKIIQFSEFKYDDDYIIGKMKNTKDKNYNIEITFLVKSGNLTEEKYCYETIKSNETKEINCLAFDIDNTYNIEIIDLNLEEFETPKLKEGKIDEDVLKYYFEDIYDLYSMFIFNVNSQENVDSLGEIKYLENENKIEIDSKIYNQNHDLVLIKSSYDTENLQINNIVTVTTENNDLKEDIVEAYSFLDIDNVYDITKALEEECEEDEYYTIGDYGYAKHFNDETVSYITFRLSD